MWKPIPGGDTSWDMCSVCGGKLRLSLKKWGGGEAGKRKKERERGRSDKMSKVKGVVCFGGVGMGRGNWRVMENEIGEKYGNVLRFLFSFFCCRCCFFLCGLQWGVRASHGGLL